MYDRDRPVLSDDNQNVSVNDLYGSGSLRIRDDNSIADWLYGEWTEEKYYQYMALRMFKPAAAYFDYLLAIRQDKEYMKRYGLTWGDIHDISKLRSHNAGTNFYGSVLNFASDNAKHLYK